MTRTRQAIIAFWVVIILLLLWEFHDYNRGMTQDAIEHPKQQHFYFYKSNTVVKVIAPVHEGAYVQQVGFEALPNTPATGSFTCRVTLKNLGTAKAMGVRVKVRPYKGIALGDVDTGGHHSESVLRDSDPNAMIGQWINFSDLEPGKMETKTTVFIMRREISPGANPQPEIIYQSEKPRDETALPAPPPMQPPHKVSPND